MGQDIWEGEKNILRLYLDDIADSKPLSREREVELAARIINWYDVCLSPNKAGEG